MLSATQCRKMRYRTYLTLRKKASVFCINTSTDHDHPVIEHKLPQDEIGLASVDA